LSHTGDPGYQVKEVDVMDMQSFGRVLSNIFGGNRSRNFQQEWDYQRSMAMSPSHRDEIDAIFRRHQGA
jgi:hypothetical protein